LGWKALKPVLEGLPGEAVVLLLDPKPTAARSKWYADKAEKRDHPTPPPKELARWLENRARAYHLKLPAAITNHLASLVGGRGSAENPAMGLEALDQELQKLTLVTPPITLEKVRAVVALEAPVDGFALVRLVTEGKSSAAFKQVQLLLDCGEDPIRVLGALSWQYTKVAKAWALLQENPMLGEGEAASALGMHPYAAKQSLLIAKGLRREAVVRNLAVLMKAEQAAKTGKDLRLALEKTVLELAGPRPALQQM
jgi:DNA polymerase-3 subunit delta